MSVSVRVTDRLPIILASMTKKSASRILLVAEALVADTTQDRDVPLDEGPLEQSGHAVKTVDYERGTVNASAIWDMPYAAYQYFTTDLNHPIQGEDHWAEKAVDEYIDKYLDIFATGKDGTL